METVFCGQCGLEFDTEELELAHICETTGFAPTEPQSMGSNWNLVATSALERGLEELQAVASDPEADPTEVEEAEAKIVEQEASIAEVEALAIED